MGLYFTICISLRLLSGPTETTLCVSPAIEQLDETEALHSLFPTNLFILQQIIFRPHTLKSGEEKKTNKPTRITRFVEKGGMRKLPKVMNV